MAADCEHPLCSIEFDDAPEGDPHGDLVWPGVCACGARVQVPLVPDGVFDDAAA